MQAAQKTLCRHKNCPSDEPSGPVGTQEGPPESERKVTNQIERGRLGPQQGLLEELPRGCPTEFP